MKTPEPRLVGGRVVADKYELVRPLGRGGMGEVWLARHTTLNTQVAIKFLGGDDPESGEQRARALERFHLEAQISAQLGARSRHVVRVDDVGEDAVGPFLVMEYVRGRSLVEELEAAQTLTPARVGAILGQLAATLAIVHEEGIVHRDLKPDNILLGTAEDGSLELKLTDFGVAKAMRRSLAIDDVTETTDGLLVGTPEYMSPEQLFGTLIDERSDCWALGVLAYEMLTGRNPFVGPNIAAIMQRVLTATVARPSTLRADLPRSLDAWFARALEKDRERRFASVREMAVSYLASLEPQTTTISMKAPVIDDEAVEISPSPDTGDSAPTSARAWARSLGGQPHASASRLLFVAALGLVFAASVAVGRSTAARGAAGARPPLAAALIARSVRGLATPAALDVPPTIPSRAMSEGPAGERRVQRRPAAAPPRRPAASPEGPTTRDPSGTF